MKPVIDKTEFGSITIAGETYEHDVIIRLDGEVTKRKKTLPKELYGTSHIVSQAEAEYVYEPGATRLIVGTGQSGMVTLSEEAAAFLKEKGVAVELRPTPEAIRCWDEASGATIGLFHITC